MAQCGAMRCMHSRPVREGAGFHGPFLYVCLAADLWTLTSWLKCCGMFRTRPAKPYSLFAGGSTAIKFSHLETFFPIIPTRQKLRHAKCNFGFCWSVRNLQLPRTDLLVFPCWFMLSHGSSRSIFDFRVRLGSVSIKHVWE